MSASPTRSITLFLFAFLAASIIAVDAQFSRLLPAALALIVGSGS